MVTIITVLALIIQMGSEDVCTQASGIHVLATHALAVNTVWCGQSVEYSMHCKKL